MIKDSPKKITKAKQRDLCTTSLAYYCETSYCLTRLLVQLFCNCPSLPYRTANIIIWL